MGVLTGWVLMLHPGCFVKKEFHKTIELERDRCHAPLIIIGPGTVAVSHVMGY